MIEIRTAEWMPDNKLMIVSSGITAQVRLNGTDWQGKYTIREPVAVIVKATSPHKIRRRN